jgi:hypothetical protein
MFYIPIYSQNLGLNNRWLLGYSSGFPGYGGININFDSLPIVATHQNRKMNFSQTNASICNARGDLLFYTNGGWIANANNDSLLNGRLPYGTYNNRYYGEPVPQECLFLPAPGDTNTFYLFYNIIEVLIPSGFFVAPKLYYLTIDKQLENGLGAVVQKDSIAINDTLILGEITACKHANGRDWWIVCHRIMSNTYYKLLLSPSGVSSPIIQNIGDTMQYIQGTGQAVFSRDGRKYASYHPNDPDNDLLILDFDRCTGNFSKPIHVSINDSSVTGGIAFSANSRFLYACSRNYIYQFDMNDTNIALSQKKVATYDGYYSPNPPFACSFYLAQLAPNDKIYINSTNSVVDLHVINYPDSIGLSCNVAQHSFPMPAFNAYTMPNHPNYFLGADSGSVCDTLMLGFSSFDSNIEKDKKISVYYSSDWQAAFVNTKNLLGKKFTMELRDVLGHLISEAKGSVDNESSRFEIPCEGLANGVYFVSINTEKKRLCCKFLKY